MSLPRVVYVLGTTSGGTGRHVAMLARGCAGAGLAVLVFGPPDAGPLFGPGAGTKRRDPVAWFGPGGEQDGAAAGFEAVAIGDRPRPARDAAAVWRLRRRLIELTPDVVHAHGLRAGALAALALRPYPVPLWPGARLGSSGGKRPPALVVTVHNAPPQGTAAAVVYGLLERLVARRADVVLCVSPDLASRMGRLGAGEVGLATVPAPARGCPAPRPADLAADGRPVVLAAGRLTAQKGFDTLIAAAAPWPDRRPEPLLVIAGTGPLAADLASQAAGSGVPARFLGWRDDVPALLAAAAVVALPSRWEGQPLILQEALRAGRPIVATDVGGVRDLTGDDAAVLVPPGDPDAFGAAVLRVLDDPDLAARLGRAAARRAAALPTESEAILAAMRLYARLATIMRPAG